MGWLDKNYDIILCYFLFAYSPAGIAVKAWRAQRMFIALKKEL